MLGSVYVWGRVAEKQKAVEEEEELKKKSQGAGEPLQTLASKLSAVEST